MENSNQADDQSFLHLDGFPVMTDVEFSLLANGTRVMTYRRPPSALVRINPNSELSGFLAVESGLGIEGSHSA